MSLAGLGVSFAGFAGLISALARLGEIEQPTLVINGRLDVVSPLETGEQLAASIPTSELKILDDAGHGPPVTRATEVADAIAAFLTTH